MATHTVSPATDPVTTSDLAGGRAALEGETFATILTAPAGWGCVLPRAAGA